MMAMIREDILQKFPDLFGTKKVNGQEVNVEQTIATLTRELSPDIGAALTARRALLQSPEPVREKYAWPKWGDRFEDPVSGQFWTFRHIVQGLIDNFLVETASGAGASTMRCLFRRTHIH
jgi:malate synthase